MMKEAAAAALLAVGLAASLPAVGAVQGFTGAWAPGTWTTSFVGDVAPPGPINNGSVNTSGAPNSITTLDRDDPSNPLGAFNSCSGGGLFGCEIQWTHAALGRFISFNWSYSTVDSCGAQCDLF